ncbi:uncharacterized protein LOC131025581 [Salvia miltiorrhiza]|uniref:uncharacterized protein LOC131025581 n=1 Tax=Salvia miltiorrhiza TaxID=226208 RepID=UPI0025AC28A3|nr:uncharacterized protein LOC131025581 [Salvia miltiorrhiza]
MGKKELSTEQQNQIVQFILHGSVNGKPSRGKLLEAQLKWSVSRWTIYRLWGAAKKQQEKGKVIHLVSGKKTKIVKKQLHLDTTLLSSLAYSKRGTIRRLVVGLGNSKSTVGRWVSAGLIRAHTSAIKPNLTAANKLLRMRFSLEALEVDRVLNKIKFKTMHNTVHIDEKWFYITKGAHRFYLAPEEVEPHRTCQSKKFIGKIMFICAASRPIFGDNGEVLFDGKIGIFHFTKQVPAKRSSKNRVAGTLETKPIESITKEVYKECVINKMIPAIISKWPASASKNIFIQQDNARPHIKDSDPEFRAAATQDGFNIVLVQQPPNSPDCNVNDLGWFRAIQSLQEETTCNSIDELLKTGHNNYKIPHMGKGAMIRNDRLPLNLKVPTELTLQCIEHLKEMGSMEGIEEIFARLGLDAIDQSLTT